MAFHVYNVSNSMPFIQYMMTLTCYMTAQATSSHVPYKTILIDSAH